MEPHQGHQACKDTKKHKASVEYQCARAMACAVQTGSHMSDAQLAELQVLRNRIVEVQALQVIQHSYKTCVLFPCHPILQSHQIAANICTRPATQGFECTA